MKFSMLLSVRGGVEAEDIHQFQVPLRGISVKHFTEPFNIRIKRRLMRRNSTTRSWGLQPAQGKMTNTTSGKERAWLYGQTPETKCKKRPIKGPTESVSHLMCWVPDTALLTLRLQNPGQDRLDTQPRISGTSKNKRYSAGVMRVKVA